MLKVLYNKVADDAYAASFQSLGQYRTALLKEINALRAQADARPVAVVDEMIERLAIKHIAPHVYKLFPNVDYKTSKQFRRLKAYTVELLAAAVAEPSKCDGTTGACPNEFSSPCSPQATQQQAASGSGDVRYDGLYEYAQEKRLDFNELCRVVHAAIVAEPDDINPVEAIGAELARVKAGPDPRGVDTLLDALGCTLREHGFQVAALDDVTDHSADANKMVPDHSNESVNMVGPDNECVVCPSCTHRFRAIPVQVQKLLPDVGYEPPFLGAQQAEPSDPTGLIARLSIHAEDRANTAFARSTMREAIGVLEDRQQAEPGMDAPESTEWREWYENGYRAGLQANDGAQALRGVLDGARAELNMLRAAMGVPTDPYDSLMERMLAAAQMSTQRAVVADSAVALMKRLKRDLMHARRFGDDTLRAYKNACVRAEGDVAEWLIENRAAIAASTQQEGTK